MLQLPVPTTILTAAEQLLADEVSAAAAAEQLLAEEAEAAARIASKQAKKRRQKARKQHVQLKAEVDRAALIGHTSQLQMQQDISSAPDPAGLVSTAASALADIISFLGAGTASGRVAADPDTALASVTSTDVLAEELPGAVPQLRLGRAASADAPALPLFCCPLTQVCAAAQLYHTWSLCVMKLMCQVFRPTIA